MSPHISADTLNFPNGLPTGYRRLAKEPTFDAQKHLQLEQPGETISLNSLGYTKADLRECPSMFGVCSAFRILSDAGIEVMLDLCHKMYSNRNSSLGTGNNRLGSYIRGAGYRSQFVRDFCDSPELAEHLSNLAGTPLARHSVPAVACGINYAPEDISRAVDSWHTDSVSFDVVMMVSDPSNLDGGEFQYFSGTKHEGEQLLGVKAEHGGTADLPDERVTTIEFPKAGYGFMQQGNMIFHRACKLNQRAERITMIPSFVVTPSTANDATNSINMSAWDDPGIITELARHEAWRSAARLNELVDDLQLNDNHDMVIEKLEQALKPLLSFHENLKNTGDNNA